MEYENSFDYMKSIENKEGNPEKHLFKSHMTIDEKLAAINSREISGMLYEHLAISSTGDEYFSPHSTITNFRYGSGYFHASMTHHYDNEGSDFSEQFHDIYVNADTENMTIVYKDYSAGDEDYSLDEQANLSTLMKEYNLVEGYERAEHVITFNITFEEEGTAIGTCDILDGETGRMYSLAVLDEGHHERTYICPFKPKVNMEERELTYLHDFLPSHIHGDIEMAHLYKQPGSTVLVGKDLNGFHEKLVEGERYADWIVRIEKGNPNFSDKELEIYQSMRKDGYPEIDTMEARVNAKESDISLNMAEKIIDKYVDKINENSTLIQSKTENEYKKQYQLHSVNIEGDKLNMKYLDRQNLGFSSKTFTYNQDNGMVSEIDTTMTKGIPQSHLVDRMSIKEMETHINTQTSKKTVSRITQNQMEGMER